MDHFKLPSIASLLLAVLVNTPFASADQGSLQHPEVSGPVSGGIHDRAWSTPRFDLSEYGYEAAEYFLEGTASAYELAPGVHHTTDGRWNTRRKSESVPYRTRILVIRPSDPAAFNGTVIVHWQNVTAGREWGSVSRGEYLRGYAWVGVSAQKVGVDGFPGPEAAGLRQWDEERYGSLVHPGDAYSYDLFTQAGRVLGPDRDITENDVMDGLKVRHLIAAGASQSAARLRTYINGVHPLAQVFDGYIPYLDFGSTIDFTSDFDDSNRSLIGRQRTRIRDDLDVPVLVVNSETETRSYLAARQPDSDTFRFWEVAGTSHVSVPRETASARGPPAPNWLSFTPVYEASLRHMHTWLTQGTPPPIMPRIEVIPGDPSPSIERDDHGNALGGIRLPDFAVATAVHRGVGKGSSDNRGWLASLYGFSSDFTDEELAALYPTRDVFIDAYDAEMDRAVKAGVILQESAATIRDRAAAWAEKLPAAR